MDVMASSSERHVAFAARTPEVHAWRQRRDRCRCPGGIEALLDRGSITTPSTVYDGAPCAPKPATDGIRAKRARMRCGLRRTVVLSVTRENCARTVCTRCASLAATRAQRMPRTRSREREVGWPFVVTPMAIGVIFVF